MLDLLLRPLRSVLGAGEEAASKPIEKSERDLGDAVLAIHRVSEAIEREVKAIEELATSVGPLKDSVNQLTGTMNDLVALMVPMSKAGQGVQEAEHGVQHGLERVENFFGVRREKEVDEGPDEPADPKPPS